MYTMKFILTKDYQSLLGMILQFIFIVKLFYTCISIHMRGPGFIKDHTKYFANN